MDKKILAQRWWEYKRGAIAITDRNTGATECLACGNVWWSNLRGGGHYRRGCMTCSECGANTRTKLPIAEVLVKAALPR